MVTVASAVVSSDGFIADRRGVGPEVWGSKEDGEILKRLVDGADLLVYGRKTHDQVGWCKPSKHLRLVLTSNPQQRSGYRFDLLSPQQIVRQFENEYRAALILGGARLYSDFLSTEAIDVFHLTVEPVTLHS